MCNPEKINPAPVNVGGNGLAQGVIGGIRPDVIEERANGAPRSVQRDRGKITADRVSFSGAGDRTNQVSGHFHKSRICISRDEVIDHKGVSAGGKNRQFPLRRAGLGGGSGGDDPFGHHVRPNDGEGDRCVQLHQRPYAGDTVWRNDDGQGRAHRRDDRPGGIQAAFVEVAEHQGVFPRQAYAGAHPDEFDGFTVAEPADNGSIRSGGTVQAGFAGVTIQEGGVGHQGNYAVVGQFNRYRITAFAARLQVDNRVEVGTGAVGPGEVGITAGGKAGAGPVLDIFVVQVRCAGVEGYGIDEAVKVKRQLDTDAGRIQLGEHAGTISGGTAVARIKHRKFKQAAGVFHKEAGQAAQGVVGFTQAYPAVAELRSGTGGASAEQVIVGVTIYGQGIRAGTGHRAQRIRRHYDGVQGKTAANGIDGREVVRSGAGGVKGIGRSDGIGAGFIGPVKFLAVGRKACRSVQYSFREIAGYGRGRRCQVEVSGRYVLHYGEGCIPLATAPPVGDREEVSSRAISDVHRAGEVSRNTASGPCIVQKLLVGLHGIGHQGKLGGVAVEQLVTGHHRPWGQGIDADGKEGIQAATGGGVLDGQVVNTGSVDGNFRTIFRAEDVAAGWVYPGIVVGRAERVGCCADARGWVPAGDEVARLHQSVTLHLRQRQISLYLEAKIFDLNGIFNSTTHTTTYFREFIDIKASTVYRKRAQKAEVGPVHIRPDAPVRRNGYGPKSTGGRIKKHRRRITGKPRIYGSKDDLGLQHVEVKHHRGVTTVYGRDGAYVITGSAKSLGTNQEYFPGADGGRNILLDGRRNAQIQGHNAVTPQDGSDRIDVSTRSVVHIPALRVDRLGANRGVFRFEQGLHNLQIEHHQAVTARPPGQNDVADTGRGVVRVPNPVNATGTELDVQKSRLRNWVQINGLADRCEIATEGWLNGSKICSQVVEGQATIKG